ncbi:hypothetical protein AgCh_000431 [Apium graveolens]
MYALDPVVRAVLCALLGLRRNQLVPRIPSPARELGVQVDRAKLVGFNVQPLDPIGFDFDTQVPTLQQHRTPSPFPSKRSLSLGPARRRPRGFIAIYANLAIRDVDSCLIPNSLFYLEGKGGLFEYIEKRLKENGHMVIAVVEGAVQELLLGSSKSTDQRDASGNNLLKDVGI